jgi:hypothetical protein
MPSNTGPLAEKHDLLIRIGGKHRQVIVSIAVFRRFQSSALAVKAMS